MATDQDEQVQAQPKSSRAELYNWQKWVHVGPGADVCEGVDELAGTVVCDDEMHFHAWVRLPTTFQQEEIRTKALASKARRMRTLRDEGSDLHAIIEEEIEALARRGDAVRERVIAELLGGEWWRYLLDATRELQAEQNDDEESTLKWEHIEDDRVRVLEIREMPEDDRPADELRVCEERVAAYDAALTERREELAKPEREELEGQDISSLLDRLRDQRILNEGSKAFTNTHSELSWLYCTYRWVEGPAHFEEMPDLVNQPEGIVTALAGAFNDLEREKGGLGLGNS